MKKFLFGLMSLMLLGGACGNDGSDNVAQVRFVHASPDGPLVDIYLDGDLIFEDIPYSAATDYFISTDGEVDIEVNAAGTNDFLVSEVPDFEQDADYTVVVGGFAASLNAVTYRDDNSLPEPGNAKVRVIHAAPSAPTVDVYVTAPGVDLNTVEPSVEDLEFEEDSDYLQVAAGDYQVRVTAADSKVPVIDVPLSLGAGQVRSALALDASGGGVPFGLEVLNDVD